MRRAATQLRPRGRGYLALCAAVIGIALLAGFQPAGQATPQPAAQQAPSSALIQHELRSFRVFGTVLHVGAHPDDENTQLINYLARGRAYRAAYLALTRGDGGQNLLGPELGVKLGVARTQELLAARRLDGGRQFFTRAFDFGFSKDYLETLRTWDRQEVLGDVVRVIRTFRPDVIITVFSTVPGGTHGHHTSSAVLALEAFKLAGDATAYPEQLRQGLKVWQPKRIFMSGMMGGAAATGATGAAPNVVRVDINGTDPVLNLPFATVAAQSRGMHKTQGFGQAPAGGAPAAGAPGGAAPGGAAPGGAGAGAGAAGRAGAAGAGAAGGAGTPPAGGGGGRGGAGGGGSAFQLLDGEPATTDIMDGIDTTWSRVAGGAEIGRLANDVIASFNAQDPSASVPALLALRARLAALPADPQLSTVVDEKRQLLDHIIAECLGLTVETTVANAEVVPGENLAMRHTATIQSSRVAVRWLATRYPGGRSIATTMALRPNQPAVRQGTQTIAANTPLTQPYWLREKHTPGMARVSDASLIGLPENPPAYPIQEVFDVGGQTITLPDEPVQILANVPADLSRRRLDVISRASLAFAPEVAAFVPGATKPVTVEITAARANTNGTLRLAMPAGWRITPASQTFRLAAAGDSMRLTFTITAPTRADSANITATAEINGTRYDNQRILIQYAHIPRQLLQPPAELKVVSFDFAIRGKTVGYLPGAGNDIPVALEQMGYTVTMLNGPDVTPERLRAFDAVVLGIRVLNTRTDLATVMPALFTYVQGGGTVIEQYSQNGGVRTNMPAPYTLALSGDRVTYEDAAVTFLAPDHPVLNIPNKITSEDFKGWVQELGTYYPNQWAPEFTPILAASDPGEAPLRGGLLVAQYGQGYFVFTGLAFFRQLPAGVPGAYRLFANLVSLGN